MTTGCLRLALCCAACLASLGLGGCAGIGLSDPSPKGDGSVRTPSGQPFAPDAARDQIVIGGSSKSDVSSALGKAIVVPFDSGYEVWVYRWHGADRTPRAATELVVLFAPSGLATKLRLRPGYAARE